MKTTTVPENVCHIFIANNASLIEKYNQFLMRNNICLEVAADNRLSPAILDQKRLLTTGWH